MTPITDDTISLLRAFHQRQIEKKQKWVPGFGNRNNGTLEPPFEEADVLKFEKRNNLLLPEDFRWYIINCTKEIFLSYYPLVIDFEMVSSDLKNTTCLIADDTCVCLPWDEPGFENCTLEIGCDGCAFFICMVIKGNRLGTIWKHTDPEYWLAANSFTHLVRHQMNLWEQGNMFPGNKGYPLEQESYEKVTLSGT